MKINLNDNVRIRLTDLGRKKLKDNGRYQFLEEDADGWSEWQLWDVMSTFGPSMTLGFEIPLETTIEVSGVV